MKLAIVIPYYKIDFFEETILSIVNQSNSNFTLYIGNDAGPENPLPIIEKYASDLSYIYFDYSENLGGKNLAMQWERILDNIREEWFQILGDDDVIDENFVEEFYKNLPEAIAKNISVIKFSHQWIDEKNNLIEDFSYPFSEISSIDFFLKKYNNEIKSSLSENIFKTSFYKKYRFEKIPLAWGSDDLAILAFSNFNRILYVNSSKVKVRISSLSISGSQKFVEEKNKAHHKLKEILILKYSSYFDYTFISSVLDDYLNTSYYKNYVMSDKVIFYYLKQFKVLQFLKALKKVYYIKKKNA